MPDEIDVITDGDGLAVIGEPSAVSAFLESQGLASVARSIPKPATVTHTASAALQAGSEIAANSGKWLKLTEESAAKVAELGLRKSASTGMSSGVLKGAKGQIAGFAEFAKTPTSILTNPAMLAGVGGIMAQLAMQQQMDEISDYLEVIDRKLDDVLRSQKDSVVADMVGVGFVIDEAMIIRQQVGRVSEVTWSKVQATSMTIARTQAYAISQIDHVSDRLEGLTGVAETAEAVQEAGTTIREWLMVLARSIQLQEASAILELDRVLDGSPDELDRHRLALRAARNRRLEVISISTDRLTACLDASAGVANTKVLLRPGAARRTVESRNRVDSDVEEFRRRLSLEGDHAQIEARRWRAAAGEARDDALAKGADGMAHLRGAGADGIGAARKVGADAAGRARSGVDRLSARLRRRVADDDD